MLTVLAAMAAVTGDALLALEENLAYLKAVTAAEDRGDREELERLRRMNTAEREYWKAVRRGERSAASYRQ